MAKLIGILGGSFDPVHEGHIAMAKASLDAGVDQVQLLPNAIAPHKTKARACSLDRIHMLELAIKNEPKMSLCRLEIDRPGPSYMIDTIKSLKPLYPQDTLALIVGYDSYINFASWKDYQDILKHCHLIVFPRKDNPKNNATTNNPALKNYQHSSDINALKQAKNAIIIHMDTKIISVSSTEIRSRLKESNYQGIGILNRFVLAYIREHRLY